MKNINVRKAIMKTMLSFLGIESAKSEIAVENALLEKEKYFLS